VGVSFKLQPINTTMERRLNVLNNFMEKLLIKPFGNEDTTNL